jgi:hypothetical protein
MEFSERLALSREVRYVTEDERRDFTRSDVWARRPMDAALSEMDMTPEEFERHRASGDAP